MSPATSRHRPVILAAAVDVLAEQGVRGLTHARLDDRAGVPSGTTSNYFRTRDALLGGVLDHLIAQDEAAAATVGANGRPVHDRESLTDLLVALGEHLTGPARANTLARYAVFLEAASHPELATRVAEARRRLNALAAEVLTAAGASDIDVAGQRITVTLDGYILATTSHGAVDATLREVLEPAVAAAFDVRR
ncbi:TetR/AcrR family transcriptional regulator [Solicola gregarius]|uniref:TetR family transcriptional regulator n=1 Tax=Solicola gregarius TaxID=2908642 RepID=A0AA46TKP2_9ACTN|nr:TetR family transcriptional regulator [Solicola gregarius]UYM07045.1 TetR family transcriptional regulator [Solicola gregarius]